MALIKLTEDNAPHFLRAQTFLIRFTNDEPASRLLVDAIDIILDENKKLDSEIDRLKKEIEKLKK